MWASFLLPPCPDNELLASWLDLNLTYYSLLTDHGIAFLDEMISAAERTLGIKPSEKQEDQSAQATRIQINLTARAGEVAVAPFVIENQYPSVLEVSFQAGDFVSLNGSIISAERITFEPPGLSLQPKEQAIIKSIVTITDDFKVGETYVTTINVLGFQAKDIALLLTILPALSGKKPRASSGSKKKPRARQTKPRRKGEPDAQE